MQIKASFNKGRCYFNEFDQSNDIDPKTKVALIFKILTG